MTLEEMIESLCLESYIVGSLNIKGTSFSFSKG